MSKKPETIFKEKVLKDLREIGYAVKIQQASIRGTPDILACINGYFVALELKSSPQEKPSKLQLLELIRIKKYKGLAISVDPSSWYSTFAAIKKFCGL